MRQARGGGVARPQPAARAARGAAPPPARHPPRRLLGQSLAHGPARRIRNGRTPAPAQTIAVSGRTKPAGTPCPVMPRRGGRRCPIQSRQLPRRPPPARTSFRTDTASLQPFSLSLPLLFIPRADGAQGGRPSSRPMSRLPIRLCECRAVWSATRGHDMAPAVATSDLLARPAQPHLSFCLVEKHVEFVKKAEPPKQERQALFAAARHLRVG